MVTTSSVIYQVYMLYWFADGFGSYSRFFNITCKLSLLPYLGGYVGADVG